MNSVAEQNAEQNHVRRLRKDTMNCVINQLQGVDLSLGLVKSPDVIELIPCHYYTTNSELGSIRARCGRD